MRATTFDHIREDLQHRLVAGRFDDPELAPALLAYVIRELGDVAMYRGPSDYGASDWASQVLLNMHNRAIAGAWPEPRNLELEEELRQEAAN